METIEETFTVLDKILVCEEELFNLRRENKNTYNSEMYLGEMIREENKLLIKIDLLKEELE